MSSFYRTLLTEKAIQEAKKVREKLNEDSLRLASIRIERHGGEHRELIQEGYAFTELYMKQARVMEEKRMIDQRRRELVSRRNAMEASNNNNGGGGSSSCSSGGRSGRRDDDVIRSLKEEEEILKVRYSSLKKRENELFSQHESLLREKELHLKEIRRVRDENASRFHSHPLMSNRYLLLNLIGKGGFSEVYLVS